MGKKERESFQDFLDRRIKEDKIVDVDYKETILELYENYMDKIYEERTPKEQKIIDKTIELSGIFQRTLSKEQITMFEEMQDLETQRHEEIKKRVWVFSYSLCNKLMVESLF